MKKSHLITINMIFFGLMLFVASVVFQFLTGNDPLGSLWRLASPQVLHVSTETCNDKQPLELTGAANAQLKKLAEYQDACHSLVSSTLMTFTGMPVTPASGEASATHTATIIKDYAKAGVRPLFVVEPSDDDGNPLDFALLANGTYDASIKAYFAKLKALGVTTEQMGIWNPLPEANLPYWNNNLPAYFSPIVNRYVKIARSYFPKLQTSILLNSATYDTTDFNWENGDYQSLLPYVKDITPGTIDYVGLQGFPWIAPQGGTATIFNATEFLNHSLLSEMADKLKTKKVWFNTGTFGVRYALDPSRVVHIAPELRKQILTTIETQIDELQSKGYTVSVNLFAEDKSRNTEETDWSYWATGKPFNSDSTPVFTEFAHNLSQRHIDLWLFDD